MNDLSPTRPKRMSFFPSSPPRVSAAAAGQRAANLFGDATTSSEAKPMRSRRYVSNSIRQRQDTSSINSSSTSFGSASSHGNNMILKPLDLNSTEDPPMPMPMLSRKRTGEFYPAGREEMLEDSDEDMFQSPRASPNTAYRTLDGRTVTSKNPFSPYTPAGDSMDDDDHLDDTHQAMQTAPTFPVHLADSLATLPSVVETPLVQPHINLSRRDNQTKSPFKQTYFGPTRDGFPEKQGQYSFTGSPIEEIDIANNEAPLLGTKIRRLCLNDNARSRQVRPINTNLNAAIAPDDVSPTDVMSFPPPPTPMKASRPQLYGSTPTAPPQTPLMDRRRRRHGDDDDDDDGQCPISMISSGGKPKAVKSRFDLDFDIIGQLGDGTFGTVYQCLSRLDGCMYAVKAAKRKAKGTSDRDRMLKEVYALAALSDQADTAAFHIVRYHQAWMEENRLYIQTELCSSTLEAEMKRAPIGIERRYKLLREMLLALEFIHRNGMVHLDIKPENIFVKNDQYKLGDFGLVSKVTNHKDVEEGDSRYMSMELLSGDHNDLTKSDIFSLGATLYELCLGRDLPMNGQEWQDIRAGALCDLHGTPFALEMFVKRMMNPDPSARPHPSELLKKSELLSDEQKQLLAEKQKVLQVNMALALQTERMKKLTPPRPGGLMRANTWNGTTFNL